MNAMPAPPEDREARQPANDRLKEAFKAWLWGSMIAATILHFGVFALWPSLTAADVGVTSRVVEAIELPAEIDLPEPPRPLDQPATPVIGPADIDEDVTIATTRLEDYTPDELPPPPENGSTTLSATRLTPYTVAPSVLNTDEIVRAMERAYPPMLRDAGIGGTVHVLFHIDEDGAVQDFRVQESSGHAALDEAALAVAELYRFSPALNRDRSVAVWVAFPITFRVR